MALKRIAAFKDARNSAIDITVDHDSTNVSFRFDNRYRVWLTPDDAQKMVTALQAALESLSALDLVPVED